MDKDVKKIFDDAIIVVAGYAFDKVELGYRIFSGWTKHTLVLSKEGVVLETSMDGIEEEIAKEHFKRNKEFLEDEE